MSDYVGDFFLGQTVKKMWSTQAADGSNITRSVDGTLRVYRDDGGLRAVSDGVVDTKDFDSLTGVHLASVDTSDNTDPDFYSAAHDYYVVIVSTTIDGISVTEPLLQFSIENRYKVDADVIRDAVLDAPISSHLTPGSVGDAIYVGATRALAKGTSITGFNDLSQADVRSAVGLGSANLDTQIGDLPTNAELTTALAAADDAVLARLGTPVGASVSADIAAVLAAVNTVDDLLDTEVASIITSLSTVVGLLDNEIALILADTNELQTDWANGGRLDLLIDGIKLITDRLGGMLELDGLVYRFTINALEQAPAGGGGGSSAAQIWSYDTANLTEGVGLLLKNKLELIYGSRIRVTPHYDARTNTVYMYRGDTKPITFDGLEGGLTGANNVRFSARKAEDSGNPDAQLNGTVVLDTAVRITPTAEFYTALPDGEDYVCDIQLELAASGGTYSPLQKSKLVIIDDVTK